jgi:hypothetical protein
VTLPATKAHIPKYDVPHNLPSYSAVNIRASCQVKSSQVVPIGVPANLGN